MKRLLATATAIAAVLAAGMIFSPSAGEAPANLVFESKAGAVTFDHAKHVERARADCATCHPGLWLAGKGDLGYKASMHKKAETDQVSCGACHRPEGQAFESKNNCKRCHVKP
jgi:c(7)-type cytochrome triheme protein